MRAKKSGPIPAATGIGPETNAENAPHHNKYGVPPGQGYSPGSDDPDCGRVHESASPAPNVGATFASSQPDGSSGNDHPRDDCPPDGDGNADGQSSTELVAWFKRVRVNEPERFDSFSSYIDGAREGRWAKEIQRIRNEADKDRRNGLKVDLLPTITASGTMMTRKRGLTPEGRGFVPSGILQIDIDRYGKNGNPDIDPKTLVQELKRVAEVCAACVSPSGDGVKAFIRIRPSVEHHRASFAAAEDLFAGLGLKIDPATKDLTRACFVTHDPDAWCRDGTPVLLPKERGEIDPAQSEPEDGGDYGGAPDSPSSGQDVKEALSFVPPIPVGAHGFREEWLSVVFAVANILPKDEAIKVLKNWSSEWVDGEYAKIIASMDEYKGKPMTLGTLYHLASQKSWPWHVDKDGDPLPRPREELFDVHEWEAEKIKRTLPWNRRSPNEFSGSTGAPEPASTDPAASGQTAQPEGSASAATGTYGPYPTKAPRLFKLLSFEELSDIQAPRDLVQGLLPGGGAFVFYGDSNTGKSFFMLDLCSCVATGRKFRGCEVDQGAVVYIALEGMFGMKKRVEALKREGRLTPGTPFFLCFSPVNLLDPTHVAELVETVREAAARAGTTCRLVVIDTMSRAMAGGNENSSEDMTRAIATIDQVKDQTGASVGIVHHSGKDAGKGSRGHSSLRGAVDAELEIIQKKDEKISIVRVKKLRDLGDGPPMPFSLKPVHVGIDDRGNPVFSCVVQHDDGGSASMKEGESANDRYREEVRKALKPGDSLSYSELIEKIMPALNLKESAAKGRVAAWKDAGVIIHENKKYRLAD